MDENFQRKVDSIKMEHDNVKQIMTVSIAILSIVFGISVFDSGIYRFIGSVYGFLSLISITISVFSGIFCLVRVRSILFHSALFNVHDVFSDKYYKIFSAAQFVSALMAVILLISLFLMKNMAAG